MSLVVIINYYISLDLQCFMLYNKRHHLRMPLRKSDVSVSYNTNNVFLSRVISCIDLGVCINYSVLWF